MLGNMKDSFLKGESEQKCSNPRLASMEMRGENLQISLFERKEGPSFPSKCKFERLIFHRVVGKRKPNSFLLGNEERDSILLANVPLGCIGATKEICNGKKLKKNLIPYEMSRSARIFPFMKVKVLPSCPPVSQTSHYLYVLPSAIGMLNTACVRGGEHRDNDYYFVAAGHPVVVSTINIESGYMR